MLVGPTGVGKTTTLAKISAQYRYALNNKFKPKIVFITADLYRLAAVEQLQKYTEILGVDLEVTYSPEEVKQALKKHKDAHLILFDTAGTAQRNMPQISTLCGIVDAAEPSEVHLVLSSTTKYSDAIDIIEHFKDMQPSRLIFSKIDESTTYGTILNICMKYKIPISYVTTGQNVPEDIECARPERIAKLLLTKPTVNRSMIVDVEKRDSQTIPQTKEDKQNENVEVNTDAKIVETENKRQTKRLDIPHLEMKKTDIVKREKRA
jgi:flagellar biosynthesis protein FlhF